jgi:tripartite-type tricarboxylate transporter receptor subunit TctC
MTRCTLMVSLVLIGMGPQCAPAQDYPARAIRLVVPSTPGGTSDILARILAPRLSEALGQQVVVDNRAGASTVIGVALAAKSTPDGYTIVITPAALATNPSMFIKLPFDTLRDLAPITRLVEGPSMMIIHPSVPAKNVKELIALAKAKPGSLIVASSGKGTVPHLAHELFRIMAGVDMPQVLYKGTGQGMISVISGELALFYASPIAVMPLINAGKLRGLGVSTKARLQALPEVPTIAETLPGYEATQWFGILAPAGTPRPIIDRLNRELARALRAQDLNARLVADGMVVVAGTPDEFARDLKSDMEKWAKVIQAAGIKPE